jgi:hypothetical protein
MNPGDIFNISKGEEPEWLTELLNDKDSLIHKGSSRTRMQLHLKDDVHFKVVRQLNMRGEFWRYYVVVLTAEKAEQAIRDDMHEEARWEKFQSFKEDHDDYYEPDDADQDW